MENESGKWPTGEMKGVWLENGRIQIRNDLRIPESVPDGVLIRMLTAGICATDLELVKGYYPFTGIPGHEFVGEVVASPTAAELIGKRVTGEINIACGICRQCLDNRPSHCDERKALGIRGHNGAFTEYVSLPLKNIVPVPAEVPDDAAVFTEPLAAACHIQQQVPIGSGQKILVLGAGRLGQLIAQSLKPSGCNLQVAARHHRQRQLLDSFGIAWLEPDQIPHRHFDVVVEATGSVDGIHLACLAVRPCGHIIVKSTFKELAPVNISAIVVDEIKIIGSRCGSFSPAIKYLADGIVDPTPLIDYRFSLNDAAAAFAKASESGVLKVLFENK